MRAQAGTAAARSSRRRRRRRRGAAPRPGSSGRASPTGSRSPSQRSWWKRTYGSACVRRAERQHELGARARMAADLAELLERQRAGLAEDVAPRPRPCRCRGAAHRSGATRAARAPSRAAPRPARRARRPGRRARSSDRAPRAPARLPPACPREVPRAAAIPLALGASWRRSARRAARRGPRARSTPRRARAAAPSRRRSSPGRRPGARRRARRRRRSRCGGCCRSVGELTMPSRTSVTITTTGSSKTTPTATSTSDRERDVVASRGSGCRRSTGRRSSGTSTPPAARRV